MATGFLALASSSASTQTPVIKLENLGSNHPGFRIDGIDAGDFSGFSVSGAGDVNGDGLADLIVGAFDADSGGDSQAGESYVIFGKADELTVDLAALGTGGFRIDGIAAGDLSGRSLSGAGDVNGDGLADLIIGANSTNRGNVLNVGESYVIFGKSDGLVVDLAMLDNNGFQIDGVDPNDNSGFSVSGAGDVNGDGVADLIVGAFYADKGGNLSAGESYVIFSPLTSLPLATWSGWAKEGDAPPLALGVTGDGSNYSTPDSRAWVDFPDGSGTGLSNASLVTVERQLGEDVISNLPNALPVVWNINTDRTEFSSAKVTFRYLDNELGPLPGEIIELYRADDLTGPWTQIASIDHQPSRNLIGAEVDPDELGYFAIRYVLPINGYKTE